MFARSTALLRGCLHRNSSTPGRCPCRLEPTIRNFSSSVLTFQEHDWQCPDPETTETPVAGPGAVQSSPPVAQSRVQIVRPPRVERLRSVDPSPPLAQSRVQSVRPPRVERLRSVDPSPPLAESGVQSVRPSRVKRRGREQELRNVESHSDQIFGDKERLVSTRLFARKLPGPEPISDLQPMRKGRPTSPQWSFPPAWRTVSLASEAESLRETTYDGFVEFWKTNYKELYTQRRLGHVAEARAKFNAHRQVAVSLIGERNVEELREAWAEMPQHDKMHLGSIMFGSLVDSARRTLLMLSLDIVFPRDWKHRCSCLIYLDLAYRDEIDADVLLQELFKQQVEQVSTIWKWPEGMGRMPWYFLALLLRHNSPAHCENIIDTLLETDGQKSSRLILVMVDHFTKIGDTDRAIDLLSRIPPKEKQEHKVRILERFANLISIDTIEKSDSVGNFRALPSLIQLGLPMNPKLHNRILERALELGVPEVAWEVFRFLEAKDIQVDARNHLLLLKDSFERNNRENLDAMMSAIHERKDLYQYPYLVTYMMHIVRVVCTIDRNLAPEKSVSHLLAVYDRAYDRAPLVKLGIVNALPVQDSLRPKLEQPPPAVLGFTIWAYVLCQHDERVVSALWFWIIHLIKQQDESVLACTKHDIMWNGFIHFYARARYYLRKAVDVVETMIEYELCMPTERTWSELLCGFLKHGEEETAAKIWKMMMARNVHPTEKGWAFLLEKYDQTQLSELVKYVLNERRMPEGIDTTLGWSGEDVARDDKTATAAEATHAPRAMHTDLEDVTGDEIFEDEALEGSNADTALTGVDMYQ